MKKRKHRIVRVTGGRVAVMNTSTVPNRDIDRALRWLAKEVDLDRVIVHVKRHGRNRWSLGMAYREIPWEANLNGLHPWEWDYLITVTDKAFFGTLAHEAKHVEQFREKLSISELRCNRFADWASEKYEDI
jgi:hypothetical protein